MAEIDTGMRGSKMASRAQRAVETRDPDVIPKARARTLRAVSDKERAAERQSAADDLKDVEEFAATLPTKFLQCREMNHTWRPYHVGRLPGGAFQRTLRCSRCYTRKIQEISSRGGILRSWYVHPEGYLREGHGRIVGEGRDALRLASIMRLDIKDLSKED